MFLQSTTYTSNKAKSKKSKVVLDVHSGAALTNSELRSTRKLHFKGGDNHQNKSTAKQKKVKKKSRQTLIGSPNPYDAISNPMS